MLFLQGFLAKLAQGIIDRLVKFFYRVYQLDKSIKDSNSAIDKEAEQVNKIVKDSKKSGVLTEDQEKQLREATRNLINGDSTK